MMNSPSKAPYGAPSRPAAPADAGRRVAGRQYVRFAFYKVDPSWRRLDGAEQAAQKQELVEVIQHFSRRMLLRPYTLVGTRADAEILLWQIAESPLPFREFATEIMRTR